MTETIETYLPHEILQKAIFSDNKYGWKRSDFKETVELGLVIIVDKYNLNYQTECLSLIGTIMTKRIENQVKISETIVCVQKKGI